jgi:hypothetical protein
MALPLEDSVEHPLVRIPWLAEVAHLVGCSDDVPTAQLFLAGRLDSWASDKQKSHTQASTAVPLCDQDFDVPVVKNAVEIPFGAVCAGLKPRAFDLLASTTRTATRVRHRLETYGVVQASGSYALQDRLVTRRCSFELAMAVSSATWLGPNVRMRWCCTHPSR